MRGLATILQSDLPKSKILEVNNVASLETTSSSYLVVFPSNTHSTQQSEKPFVQLHQSPKSLPSSELVAKPCDLRRCWQNEIRLQFQNNREKTRGKTTQKMHRTSFSPLHNPKRTFHFIERELQKHWCCGGNSSHSETDFYKTLGQHLMTMLIVKVIRLRPGSLSIGRPMKRVFKW